MTIKEFLAAVEKAGLRFVIKRDRTIRTRSGMCPVVALAYAKKLMPVQALFAAEVWWAAHRLGLSDRGVLEIVCAADYTYTQNNRAKHRRRYAPKAKQIRKFLIKLSEREK